MKTIQQDVKSSNLSLNEAIGVAQNHPCWRLMSMFGVTRSYWCLPMNERMSSNSEPSAFQDQVLTLLSANQQQW